MAERPHVLVVDDDFDMRNVLSEVLSDEGFDVRTAGDGIEALASARSEPPDLILLDLMMPRMNGWEFLAERRRDEDLGRIPVLVVSAFGRQMDALEAGATGLVPKPIHYVSLMDSIRRACAPKAS